MRIPTFAADKLGHFLWGLLAALIFAAIVVSFGRRDIAGGAGLFAALCVAAAKEGSDLVTNYRAKKAGLLPPHTVDPKDAIATLLGGVAVYVAGSLL